MRIISFNKMWNKLSDKEFTTFRYPRADKDWFIGEFVQVYFKSRSQDRKKLGEAIIISKEVRELDSFFTDGIAVFSTGDKLITEEEAVEDGFVSVRNMTDYMEKQYGLDYISRFNKLTLRWI